MAFEKIVSGGQTGVDRGALDAALGCGFACGGWCPPGRAADDGVIATKYPLIEIDSGGYRQRTIRNVIDSDATLVIYWSVLHGGTEQTVLHCIKRRKPFKLIDASILDPSEAAHLAAQFVESTGVSTLNVAGPRESRMAGASEYARLLVQALITEHR